jgi:hypothetical protein
VTLSLNSTGQEIDEEKEFKRLEGWQMIHKTCCLFKNFIFSRAVLLLAFE